MHTMELTNDELYFLNQVLGWTSTTAMRKHISNCEKDSSMASAIANRLQGMVNSGNSPLDTIYYKSAKIIDKYEPESKYLVLYKSSSGKYGVSDVYYKSLEEFNQAMGSVGCTAVQLVADSRLTETYEFD